MLRVVTDPPLMATNAQLKGVATDPWFLLTGCGSLGRAAIVAVSRGVLTETQRVAL